MRRTGEGVPTFRVTAPTGETIRCATYRQAMTVKLWFGGTLTVEAP